MNRCWSEGNWRAYHDREMPPAELEAAAKHLQQCAACELLYRQVAARAERVDLWLKEVDAPFALAELRPQSVALASRGTRAPRHFTRWGLPAAIAAALLAGLWLWPRHPAPNIRPSPPPFTVPTEPPTMAQQAPPPSPRPAPAPAPVRLQERRKPRPPSPRVDYYMALDSDPIDSGVVLRVAFGDGSSLADVLVDSQGRPRAIRPVSVIR